MATNKHAQIRYIALDKCFSNFNHKFSFEDLIEACCDAIFQEKGDCNGVSTRTIRGDLSYMKSSEGYSAPIKSYNDNGVRYYRYEDRDFSINKQPLNTTEIEQLKNTLVMLNRFKGLPQFDWMDEVVTRLEGSFNLRTGVDEIVSFEQNPNLKGLSWFTDLFNAIVSKQVLDVDYRAGFGEAKQYTLHPYHLKQYNNRWFLFGLNVSKKYSKIMNMALDRIDGFRELKVDYIENKDINFGEYFDDVVGVTVPDESEPIRIKLKVDSDRYHYIESKPIHPTQTVVHSEGGDGYTVIELTLSPNYEFRTLLLGFADGVEIIEPQSLKAEITERAENILAKNK
ncbi:MAG: WYL domain-containing protein [Rikenellaceae bacterium]